jgi:tetratricopeptide (TPR) repeat protein
MPPAFRAQLASEAGDLQYAADDPRGLPSPLRTAPWEALCKALDEWHALPVERKCRLLILLHSLCFYALAEHLPSPYETTDWQRDVGAAELAFWAASSGFMVNLPKRMADYVDADLSVFAALAREGPPASVVRFNGAVMVFVHKAKTGRPLDEISEWAAVVEGAFLDTVAGLRGFAAELLTSRFYRAMGFLPQRAGDKSELVRVMDLAERHATRLTASDDAEQILRSENLHAVMESRTKEAISLGDLDTALVRAQRVVEVDPCDSKALVELGEVRFMRKEWQAAAQAYLAAATLGPPASAIGRHMAALCFKELGETTLSAFLFKETLETDPLGISPRDEIRRLPAGPLFNALRDWSRATVKL